MTLIMTVPVPSEMVSVPVAFPRSAATRSTTEVELDLDVTTKWTPVRFAMAVLAAISTEPVVGTWAAPAAPAMADSMASVDAANAEPPIERPRRRDVNRLINEGYSRDHSHGEHHPVAENRVRPPTGQLHPRRFGVASTSTLTPAPKSQPPSGLGTIH